MDIGTSSLQSVLAAPTMEQAELQALCVSERRAPRNTCILRPNDTGPRLRTLRTGWAVRCRMFSDGRRQIIGILLPGDTFGVETLFDDALDHLVWSTSAVTYSVLDGDAAANLFDSAPWFRRRLMRGMAEEKAAAERWMSQLGRCDAEERTAALLVLLHERLSNLGLATCNHFRMELTQQDLADMLGLHLIHLNRILSRLRARRLIMMKGQEFTLLDLDGLAELIPVSSHVSSYAAHAAALG